MRSTTTRALLFACAIVGCTSSGNDDAGAEGPASASVALLRLERFQQDDTAAPRRLVANAKIARFTGLDGSSVLKLLGAEPREGEGCVVSSRLDGFPLDPGARLSLLSIGDISLRAGERVQRLSPRLFPDLASTASGWFYASGAELAAVDGGVERDDYALSASGEQGVGHFEITLAAPGAVTGLTFDGGEPLSLARAADVQVSWDVEDLHDQVELEIYAGSSVLACSAEDDGQFTLPAAKLAQLEPDTQATIIVRRVLSTSTEMQGIESALVRFATTRTSSLSVQ